MVTLRQINIFALVICFLLYLTCYFRFAGQALLTITQIISGIFVTIEIFSKPKNYKIKSQIKTYWIVTILNIIVLFSFFNFIMWNDFLQVTFVTLIPNITAIYFYRILIKYEDLGFVH
ncbi:hypothetical protein EV145_105378 [Flavobacterium sp. 245]|nr:hypothetical protein EV145_105378 [Flavobacterium sp. 245]